MICSGVYGFWPAASDGEDVVLYADEERHREVVRFNMLRQQREKSRKADPYVCLADYIAPVGSPIADYLGARTASEAAAGYRFQDR